MGNIDLNEWLKIGGAVVAFITAAVHVFIQWKKGDEIELKKLFAAGLDALHVVFDALADGKPEDEAINEGVQKVVQIRGHNLSAKSDRKLKAFFQAKLRNGSLQIDEPPGREF